MLSVPNKSRTQARRDVAACRVTRQCIREIRARWKSEREDAFADAVVGSESRSGSSDWLTQREEAKRSQSFQEYVQRDLQKQYEARRNQSFQEQEYARQVQARGMQNGWPRPNPEFSPRMYFGSSDFTTDFTTT